MFGAFIAGIVLGRSRFHDTDVFDQIDGVTRSFFAPLFFATAGLRVDLGLLRDPTVLGWGVIVVAVASASKGVGAYLGSRLAGLPAREGLALGAGLNARGAVEIVVATVGLSLGVLTPPTARRAARVATSMIAPRVAVVLRDDRSEEGRGAARARERQPAAPARARLARAAAEPGARTGVAGS